MQHTTESSPVPRYDVALVLQHGTEQDMVDACLAAVRTDLAVAELEAAACADEAELATWRAINRADSAKHWRDATGRLQGLLGLRAAVRAVHVTVRREVR